MQQSVACLAPADGHIWLQTHDMDNRSIHRLPRLAASAPHITTGGGQLTPARPIHKISDTPRATAHTRSGAAAVTHATRHAYAAAVRLT